MLGPVLDPEHQACCTVLRQGFARRQMNGGADAETVGRLLGRPVGWAETNGLLRLRGQAPAGGAGEP